MIESKKKRIGKHEYDVTQFGSSMGRKVLVKLLRLVGPAAAEAFSSGKGDRGGAAIAALASAMNEEDFEEIYDAFAKASRVEVAPNKWPLVSDVGELHFAGNYAEMLGWLAFGLEVNYANFFGGLGIKGIADAADAMASASESPTVSIGSSGE